MSEIINLLESNEINEQWKKYEKQCDLASFKLIFYIVFLMMVAPILIGIYINGFWGLNWLIGFSILGFLSKIKYLNISDKIEKFMTLIVPDFFNNKKLKEEKLNYQQIFKNKRLKEEIIKFAKKNMDLINQQKINDILEKDIVSPMEIEEIKSMFVLFNDTNKKINLERYL